MNWQKYRFIIIGFIFRMILLNMVSTYEEYSRITQTVPTRIIEFAFMSVVLICNIFFILDFLYDYLKMENAVCVRITFEKYRMLLIKRVVLASAIIIAMECIIALIFGSIVFTCMIINIFIMAVLFIVAILYWRNIHENSFAICLYIISLIIRQIVMIF